MPHVSRNELDKKLERELYGYLEIALGKLSPLETREFLFSLLSRTEKLMLAKRLAIVMMLKEDIQVQDISRALHVTRETVLRTQMKSEIKGNGYEIALKKLKNDKTMREFKDFLLKLAGYSVRAAGGRVKPEII
jgi:uncharacterized protein YerC